MTLQEDLERPERQLREIIKEEHFMQKEHQKMFGKNLVGNQLGVVTGVLGREDGNLA